MDFSYVVAIEDNKVRICLEFSAKRSDILAEVAITISRRRSCRKPDPLIKRVSLVSHLIFYTTVRTNTLLMLLLVHGVPKPEIYPSKGVERSGYVGLGLYIAEYIFWFAPSSISVMWSFLFFSSSYLANRARICADDDVVIYWARKKGLRTL